MCSSQLSSVYSATFSRSVLISPGAPPCGAAPGTFELAVERIDAVLDGIPGGFSSWLRHHYLLWKAPPDRTPADWLKDGAILAIRDSAQSGQLRDLIGDD